MADRLVKYLAITACPQGQSPGDIFEATEDAGNVLVLIGSAKPYDEPPITTEPVKSSTRRYTRKDLEAEG